MVDVTEISAVIAAIGVLIGVVYYILDIRHQSKTRSTCSVTMPVALLFWSVPVRSRIRS